MDRSDTYNFLLMFHSNMGLSCTVSETDGNFHPKPQIFPTPVYFAPPLNGFNGNWVSALGIKNQNHGATGKRKKFDDIFSRLDTIHQRDGQTDGRTDGWMDTGRQQRSVQASSGKNRLKTHFVSAFVFCSSIINLIPVAYVVRRPCSDFTHMLRRLINCRIISIIIPKCHTRSYVGA